MRYHLVKTKTGKIWYLPESHEVDDYHRPHPLAYEPRRELSGFGKDAWEIEVIGEDEPVLFHGWAGNYLDCYEQTQSPIARDRAVGQHMCKQQSKCKACDLGVPRGKVDGLGRTFI